MKKILYFVHGGLASSEQKEEALALGAVFRNASITSNDFIERCDAVAGDVPERYQHFPRSGEILAEPTGKPLSDMTNKELDAKAEALDIKFPSRVNAKAGKVAFITEYLASSGQSDA